jgi:hypothetical protein
MTNCRWALTPLISLIVIGFVGGCTDDEGDAAGEAQGTTTTTTTTSTVLVNPATSREEEGPPEANPCVEGEDFPVEPPEVNEPPGDGAEPVQVTAREYSFSGVQAMDTTGEYALVLANEGDELHQIVIQRIEDDDRPALEILNENVPSDFTTDIAFGFACPDEVAEPVSVNLDQPGRYIASCFIPSGITTESPPEDFDSDAPAHAARGMFEEFHVSS